MVLFKATVEDTPEVQMCITRSAVFFLFKTIGTQAGDSPLHHVLFAIEVLSMQSSLYMLV